MKYKLIQGKETIMINVPIDSIKQLRKETLLNIKECKEALIQSRGDINGAKLILKKNGFVLADKRKFRRTSNGAVFLLIENNSVVTLELTCETESVAMNRIFLSTGEQLSRSVLSNRSSEITEDMNILIKESISIIKENMVLRNITLWNLKTNEVLGSYKHNDNKVVTLVKFKCNNLEQYNKNEISVLANEIAMHICACRPMFISVDRVDNNYIKENREIFTEQIKKNNSNSALREKIVSGKLNKHLKNICLLEQDFVKDPNKKVTEVINNFEKHKGDIKIIDFNYLQVEPFIMI